LLKENGFANEEFFEKITENAGSIKKEIIRNLKESSLKPISDLDSLVEDVYKNVPKNLKSQFSELKENMEQFPEYYSDKYYFRK
jgi:TPP-dependent pyruvate/acetoin dehydrogenase alpha subunit